MKKRFLKKMAHDLYLYPLTIFNLTRAIKKKSFGWWNWVSLALCGISIALNIIIAFLEEKEEC